jgi:NAD(P)-dependent dehydrogenase (short-subunit alcohol dehydrogenase family)
MKKTTLDALAMSLCAATSAHAEKPTNPQTELIVKLAVITVSVDRCHFALDRYGSVDEVAALVAFGPEASYITGANLTVDGGTNA